MSPEGRSGQEQSLFSEDILLCNVSSRSLVLNLNTFRESKFKTQNCDVLNLQLRKTVFDDPLTISALTFPVICLPLTASLVGYYQVLLMESLIEVMSHTLI